MIGQHAPTSEVERLAAQIARLEERVADLQRARVAPEFTYTPSLTATSVNPNVGSTAVRDGQYQVVDGRCRGRATVYAQGSGIAAGTGSYRVSLPVPVRYLPNTSITPIGYGLLYIGNPAAGMHPVALDATPSTTTARILGEGFEAGSSLAGGFAAAGNCLWIAFDYPI